MTNQTADGFQKFSFGTQVRKSPFSDARCAGAPRDFLYTIICTSHVIW